MKAHFVNPSDRDWTRGRYLLWFGSYAPLYLMTWANSLDSALDQSIDWLAENAPGLLCEDEVAEAYADGIKRGLSEEEAIEDAEVDTTIGGNNGLHISSQEWGIVYENPTREQVLQFQNQ